MLSKFKKLKQAEVKGQVFTANDVVDHAQGFPLLQKQSDGHFWVKLQVENSSNLQSWLSLSASSSFQVPAMDDRIAFCRLHSQHSASPITDSTTSQTSGTTSQVSGAVVIAAPSWSVISSVSGVVKSVSLTNVIVNSITAINSTPYYPPVSVIKDLSDDSAAP